MNVEQKARELLAEELRRDGRLIAARNIESGITQREHQAALRTIARALQQQGGSEAVAELVAACRGVLKPYIDQGDALRSRDRLEAALAAMGATHQAEALHPMDEIGQMLFDPKADARVGGEVADATLPVVIRGRVYEVPIPVQLRIVALEDALGASGAKPVCYLRTLNGAPDWAEDCVCEEPGVVLQYHDEADGYGEMPLYTTPPAPVVPEGIIGELVEMGDDDDGCPRLVVATTREAIKKFGPNLLFKRVMVAAAQQPEKE